MDTPYARELAALEAGTRLLWGVACSPDQSIYTLPPGTAESGGDYK